MALRPGDLPHARTALLDALDRVDLGALAERLRAHLQDGDEAADPGETRQFLNALETLIAEGMRGEGRDMRDLVFDTAIPGLVARGSTALELLESHVVLFVALATELTAAVPADVRDDAAVWLAAWFADYTREVTERALALEGGPAA